MTLGECKRVLAVVAAAIEAHANELSELDAAGGDGDHGMSLAVGARASVDATRELDDDRIGPFLETIGKTLISAVGAAMGPLYGTACQRAGKVAGERTTLDAAAVAEMLAAARDGIIARGKTKVGDKTMLDAFDPAATAAAAAASAGSDGVEALRAASEAADAGAVGTRDMIATKGRAARLGERTRGHQDAGATSTALILRAILSALDPSVTVATATSAAKR